MRSIPKALVLLAAAPLVLLAGCSASGSDDSSADGKVTLSISTFSEWGYDDLIEEYQELNPDITIEQNKFATSDEAKEKFQTSLGAGSGLSDIVGVDNSWLPQVLENPDNFVDLSSPDVEGRWNQWNVDLATSADGKLLGYATDIGPSSITYRADLFEAAGLPSDRESVAELFGGDDATWDDFFAVGEKFKAANTGVPFYDASASVATSWGDQYEVLWEDPDNGDIIAGTNPELKKIYDTTMKHDDLSAHLARWTEDWNSSFQNDGFAVMLSHSRMLGVIEGNAAGVTGWDVADVFPGGGGNSGGSYLTVPTQVGAPGGGSGPRRVADRPGAAAEGLRVHRQLPQPGGGAEQRGAPAGHERVLQQRTRRPDPHRPLGRGQGDPLQGRQLLRDHGRLQQGDQPRLRRQDPECAGVLGHVPG